MRLLTTAAMLLLLLAPLASGDAHVNLYLPHLIDGGNQVQKWQTWFIFVNPNESSTASATLYLYGNNGSPLALDLGQGVSSTCNFSVPPLGRVTLRSKIASQTVVAGWALAYSNIPLQATVLFRMIDGGTAKADFAAPATLPSYIYRSAASRNTGIALANVYDTPITATVTARHQDGSDLGTASVPLPALGHWSGNLYTLFPGIPDFLGSVEITTTTQPNLILAWTLNEDGGMISTLPPGRNEWPISHWDRIWLVYLKVLDVAERLDPVVFSSPITLRMRYEREVNAYARGGNEIGVWIGLSELISDSPSELAWALAHELGRIYQQRTGRLDNDPTSPEFDADIWGVVLTTFAGYDPYASAGALAKLAMATGRAGLTTQFEDQLAADAHKSFNTRIDTVYDSLVLACRYPTMQSFCSEYKLLVHPHLPPSAPLRSEWPTR
jgi:hypothetical protein